MKRFALLCAAAAVTIANPAFAARIFTLDGVTLAGGGTLVGTFETNDAMTQLTAINITASSGTINGFTFAAYTYDNAAQASWVSLPTQGFQITSLGGARELRLNLQPLTATGALITPDNSYEWQNQAGPRSVLSGRAIVAPVPEPATWAMMIAGFGLVGGAMRRRATNVSVRFASV